MQRSNKGTIFLVGHYMCNFKDWPSKDCGLIKMWYWWPEMLESWIKQHKIKKKVIFFIGNTRYGIIWFHAGCAPIIVSNSSTLLLQNVTKTIAVVYFSKHSIIRGWSYNFGIYSPLRVEISFSWTLVIRGIAMYSIKHPEYYSTDVFIWTWVNIN